MTKISKKDKVKVIYGKHKGSVGTVLKVFPKEQKLIVEGINKVRRHKKSKENSENFTEKEAPLHISKVVLVDPKTEKPIKVGFTFKDKIKIRINKKTGQEVPKVI